MTGQSEGATGRGLIVGIGCESGTAVEAILHLVLPVLCEAGYPALPLLAVVSLDTRAREPALLSTAAHFAVPLLTFNAARLEAETKRLKTPSALVFRLSGCHGVAEAAALAAGGVAARLVVPKRKSAQATVAVVETESVQWHVPIGSEIESSSSQIESSACPVAVTA